MNLKKNKAWQPPTDESSPYEIITRTPEEFFAVTQQQERGELIIYSADVLCTNGHYRLHVRRQIATPLLQGALGV